MLPIARNGYTRDEIIEALHGVYRPPVMKFRYDLLDKDDKKKGTLTTVINGEISCDSLATIKRKGTFRMKDDDNIDWLTDRIQPWALLKMPDGGYAEFPLGVFLLSSPKRKDQNQGVYRDVDAYDGLQILKEDRFPERYAIPAGTKYYDAVIDILEGAGITKYNIENTDKTLTKDKEFEPGKEKLYAINELLQAINYDGIQVDVYGYFNSSLYRLPSQRASEYTYQDDWKSVTVPGMEEELDLNEVYNQFVVVRTNEEQEPLSASYTNNNPDSPVSTVNLGRTRTDYREVTDIADQEALNGYVERIAHEATKIYGKLSFNTAIMPFHDIDDVLQINYSRLDISRKYIETEWSFPLQAGATMKHEVRRVIYI